MKKKAIIFLMLCVAMRLGFEGLSEIFYLNVTSSLPQGLYMKVPCKEFSRGDYIIYEPSEEVKEIIIKNGWGDGNHDFLKKVGAVAGDKYSIDAETSRFEIEGQYIGKVFEKDNVGHELPKLRGKFEVPQGYILPIATSERSFDGRYSGVIEKNRIKARVTPIFTF
ncbi:MAG: S26 family signal peptidase [Selenomonadaceae bacterium]|nr:S26 family signal peptidase [Selenomonadaceae bacterium]